MWTNYSHLAMLAGEKLFHLGPKGRQGYKADLLPLVLPWWENMRHHLYNFQSLLSWTVAQVFQAASQPTQLVILAGAEVTFLLDTTTRESESEFLKVSGILKGLKAFHHSTFRRRGLLCLFMALTLGANRFLFRIRSEFPDL